MGTWFSENFGFDEADYDTTQSELYNRYDLSDQTIAGLKVGRFSMPSLRELRELSSDLSLLADGEIYFQNITGEARELHLDPNNEGATFQVASQFNLLEFPAPNIVPEQGVTNYATDHTQGPACAIACPAGTVFRNYLMPMSDESLGQRADSQINTLADLERKLPVDYWHVKNGYIDSSEEKLMGLNMSLYSMDEEKREELKGCIRVGVHNGVQVIDFEHTVQQVYASAVSVGYSKVAAQHWEPLAKLVLESAYESTLRLALIANEERLRLGLHPQPAFLTKLGGGVFGNKAEWINDSILTAIWKVKSLGKTLDIRLVHYGKVSDAFTL